MSSGSDENIYDTIEIEDLEFESTNKTFYYPCPCGDKFAITLSQIMNGSHIAQCPSCSLKIQVVYEVKYVTENYSEYI